ncbi:MAG TPA: hypothetical protein PKD61_17755 [Polyangiaceae bacterium]|nr:hypothetical protein [Polyangiaceae bacterium]
MNSPSNGLDGPVVLDASVLINLIATADPSAVLGALGSPVVVGETAREVRRNPRTGAISTTLLEPFLAEPLTQVELTDNDADRFVELVSAAPPNDLDDGEAATLAYGTHRRHAIALDERKAWRIVSERFDEVQRFTTVGLYRHLLEHRLFDRAFIGSCVYDSCRFARMRVAAREVDWVLALLDPRQVADCPGLRRHHRSD